MEPPEFLSEISGAHRELREPILQFTSIEEIARCICSGSGLILCVDHSKLYRTESLPLRNTQSSGLGALVNTRPLLLLTL